MSKPRAALVHASDGDAGSRSRSASRSVFRRIAAAVTALVFGAGLALVAVAAPASAHTPSVQGVATCAEDGTYTVVWTVNGTNVPSDAQATVKVVEPEENAGVELKSFTGNGSTEWIQYGVAATEQKATASFSIGWPSWGPTDESGSVDLTGTCTGEETPEKIEFCHATGSETNPYERIETSVNAFLNAGHRDHQNKGDIYPAFTFEKKGVTIEVPAQGDQSLLQYEDCAKPTATRRLPRPSRPRRRPQLRSRLRLRPRLRPPRPPPSRRPQLPGPAAAATATWPRRHRFRGHDDRDRRGHHRGGGCRVPRDRTHPTQARLIR